MDKDTWKATRFVCPQCGKRGLAYKNAQGDCKMECSKCGSVAYSKRMDSTKRVITLKTAAN